MPAQPARTARSYLLRAAAACALLVVIFYLAPVERDATGGQLVLRSLLAIAAAVLLALVIGRMVTRVIRNEPGVRLAGLLVALFAGLVLFAFVDFMIAVSSPGQFQGLRTKTDALYFAVSTLATVGFGDVHASGQLARAVVTGQMLFNLAVIATGGTVLVGQITGGRRRSRPGPPESSR
jgi:voltage-gated potassium channel